MAMGKHGDGRKHISYQRHEWMALAAVILAEYPAADYTYFSKCREEEE
jgi:hypothetical protein